MMTSSQVRKLINDKINAFTGIQRSLIQIANQPNFKPPLKELWCRVTVDYAPSVNVGINDGSCVRDFGLISIQCFTPVGSGDIAVMELADKWRAHWKDYGLGGFEVIVTHAPTSPYSEVGDNYVITIVRIEFRVN